MPPLASRPSSTETLASNATHGSGRLNEVSLTNSVAGFLALHHGPQTLGDD
jgi:hypothetical protein